MCKRVVSIVLAMLLLLSCTSGVAASLTKEELYSAALSELKAYLNDSSSTSPDKLFDTFSGLGSFEYSAELAIYTRVLNKIWNEDFDQIDTLISLLRMNEAFCTFVLEDGDLGTVDELAWYAKGLQAEAAGDKVTAVSCYQKSISFKDSFQRIVPLQETIQGNYDLAQKDLAEGKRNAAFYHFLRAGENQDAMFQARLCGNGVLISSDWCLAAIDSDGKVLHNNPGVIETSGWEKINSLTLSMGSVIALDEDGRMYVSGYDESRFPITDYKGKWEAFYATDANYAALRADGTVVWYSYNESDALVAKENEWKNITDVKLTLDLLVGLTDDGRIVAMELPGHEGYLLPDKFANWNEMRSIEVGNYTIGGVRKDGTVLISNYWDNTNQEVATWENVATIEINSEDVIFGLKMDGTVVVADDERTPAVNYDEEEIAQWKDIVAITANEYAIIGMKSNGSLVVSQSEYAREVGYASELVPFISTWNLMTE